MPHQGKVKEKLKNEVLSLGISIFGVHLFPSHLSLNWAARKSWGFLGGLGASERRRTSAEALYPGAGCCTQQVLLEEVEGADPPLGGP